MSTTLEIERTFLLNAIPVDLSKFTKIYLCDVYIPPSSTNPQIRLRQIDSQYYITKKYPKNPLDLSTMIEETIHLDEVEFNYFRQNLAVNILEKTRYKMKSHSYTLDLDVYLGELSPLIVLDVEIESIDFDISKILTEFDIKEEVANKNNYAGGKMAGKKFE